METEKYTSERVLTILLKEPFSVHTATSLAKTLRITRQGIWKRLNKLRKSDLVNLEFVGKTKTSTATVKLNWANPITEKTLSLLLMKESLKLQRWRANFAELENNTDFLILFGSILINPKEANDIDILLVANKKKFKTIETIVIKIQQTQLKKIHLIDLTAVEFSYELKKSNKSYIDAVKKGMVLYGQDSFVQFIKDLQK